MIPESHWGLSFRRAAGYMLPQSCEKSFAKRLLSHHLVGRSTVFGDQHKALLATTPSVRDAVPNDLIGTTGGAHLEGVEFFVLLALPCLAVEAISEGLDVEEGEFDLHGRAYDSRADDRCQVQNGASDRSRTCM